MAENHMLCSDKVQESRSGVGAAKNAMYIGMSMEEIETPALLIDLDLMEENIETMGRYYRGKKGAALRPHQKGHRLPQIARKQIEAGAVGVCMTSPALAELYVNSGIDNILITREVSGKNKIARLCGLSKHGSITMSVDDVENARQISNIARDIGAKVNVAVEVYLSYASCGVELDQVKSFVREISGFEGTRFRGIWWHDAWAAGSLSERRKLDFATMDKIAVLKDGLEDAGFEVEMLSGGQTSTWNITPEYTGLKNVEVQAGNYVSTDWMDRQEEGLDSRVLRG